MLRVMPDGAWAVIGVVLFAGASFFFALAESSLFSLGRWRARSLVESSPGRGAMVARLLETPQDLLATVVWGNTFANALLIGIAFWTALAKDWAVGWVSAAAVGLFTLILLGCEVVPKTLGVRAPEPWCLRIAPVVTLLVRVFRPLLRRVQLLNTVLIRVLVPKSFQVVTTVSDEEYQEMMEMAAQSGSIAPSEKEMILQILRLDRRAAKDVMKPRSQMACIRDDLSVEEMMTVARRHRHRRLPMYDETPDTIVGVLNTRAFLLDPGIDLADAIELPSFVPESMNLLQLLKSLQRQRRGLAIVLDEFGGTAGLVTTEDILEEMIGELRGEGEEQGFIMAKLGEGRWRVGGTMRLEDFRREYPDLGELDEIDTMGGLVCGLLEVVPLVGQSITFQGLRLTVTAGDERRVREVLVETAPRKGGR